MKHITSKLLSLLLCLAMLMSMVPVAYAEDETGGAGGENPSTETYVAKIGEQKYQTLDAAITAAPNDATITILATGEYKLNGNLAYAGKAFTIEAAAGVDVAFDMSAAVALHGAKITFKGVTFNYKTNGNYIGLQHADTLEYNNCTINGQVFLYAASETFNGCTFNQTSADAYNVWTYGAQMVEFNQCTFHCAGKSVLVYNEGAVSSTDLTVTDTEFNASAPVAGKAAIEIDTSLMPGGATITIDAETKSKVSGFDTGSKSGNSLWNDKKQTTDNNKNTTVTVAGETVFAPAAQSTAAAMTADGREYTMLEDALAAVTPGNALTEVTEKAWPSETPVYYNGVFYGTIGEVLYDAQQQKGAIQPGVESAVIYCRPGATISKGNASHPSFVTSTTIYGNGATLTGATEWDVENYFTLTKDITINIYSLNGGASVWSTRKSDFTVTVNMENCQDAHEVLFNYGSGDGRVIANVKNCTFLKSGGAAHGWPVSINCLGSLTVDNCIFDGVITGVVVNVKQPSDNGEMKVSVTNSTFNNVTGQDSNKGALRVTGQKECKIDLTIGNVQFTGTRAVPEDITLGNAKSEDNLGEITYTISNTTGSLTTHKVGDTTPTTETLDSSKIVTGTNAATADDKGTEANPYTLAELGAMTRDAYIAAQTRLGGTMYVTVDDYSYGTNGVLGNGERNDTPGQTPDHSKLNAYGENGYLGEKNDGANGKNIVFVGGSITSDVTGYKSIDNIGTSLLLAVPAYTNVTFKGTEFNNVMSFDYQLYTSPWSQLGELKFDGCTFNGIIVGAIAAQTLTFNKCTFTNYENTNPDGGANNSNPIWVRPAYGNWTKGDNEGQGGNFKSLTTINFTGNTVTSTRPVKFERIAQWEMPTTVTATGNSFDIKAQTGDDSTKNVGLYFGANAKFDLVAEGNKKAEGSSTAALYTAVYSAPNGVSYAGLPAGSTVKNSQGNEAKLDALKWKATDTDRDKLTLTTTKEVASLTNAKVTVNFATLQEAIDAAARNATVKLLADTKENVTISTPYVTLDLNGHTLNGSTGERKPALTITARVTVKDSSEGQTGTIMREDTAENSGVSSHYVIDVQGSGWLTFESGTVKNDSGAGGTKGASLVRVGDDSVAKYPGLNIKGGTFTQDNFIVIKVDRGDLFLNGGALNSANSYAVQNWLRATIKGGTVNGNISSWTYEGGPGAQTTISGGTVNGNVEAISYDGKAGKPALVSISGGTVNGTLMTGIYGNATEPSKDMATIEVTGGTFSSDPTKYVVEDSSVTPNSDGTYGVAKAYLAKVGETSYYTMDEAFKAQTASGEPIVLLRDYTTGSTFNSGSVARVVDLNKHTWTCTGTDANSAAFEINYANASLTVKNGKIVSSQLVGLIPSASHGTITYDNSNLVFDGVEMTTTATSGIETNGNNTNDKVTLRNSTLNVPNGFGIYFPSSGKLTIENSTINAKTMGVQVCAGSLNITGDKTAIDVSGDPVVKIEGDGAIQDGAAISIVNRIGYKGLGDITVTGGTFTAKSGNAAIKAYDWKNNTAADFTAKNNVAVSGGTFSSAVPEDLCAEGYKPIKNPDGTTYGVQEIMYAQIGETKYKTLADALAAAKDGETVTLLADVTEDVTINKSITLDLGGKTLTNTSTGKATISVTGGTVTVKNGNVIGGTSYYNIEVTKGSNANLTLEGVTATAGNTGSSMIDNWGTLTITSGTYTGGLDTVKSEEDSKLTITGGKFVSDYAPKYNVTGTILVYGETAITGGEFVQNSTSTAARVVVTGVVEGHTPSLTKVSGGKFTTKSSGAIFHWMGKATPDNFEVSGGSYSKSVSELVCADGFIPTKNADGTYGVKEGKYVAAVGSKKYETLADAIRLAARGKTVTLLADTAEDITIAANKCITLDLNGKTLTNKADHTITVEAGASLTINGKGTVDNVTHAMAAIVNYGTVVLNGGTYTRSLENAENNKNDAGGNSYYTILNDKGGHMTINEDVTVTNAGHFSSMIRNGGDEKSTEKSTLIITGGTFSGGINTIKNDEFGVLEIKGGSFSNTSQYVVMNWNKADISGGTFEANATAEAVLFTAAYLENRAVGELTITSGTFKTTSNAQALIDDTYDANHVGTAAISGGSFSKQVEQKWCALGFEPKDNGNGTYGVKAAEGNAAMFDAEGKLIGYADVEVALKKSEAKTVKLIKDVTDSAVNVILHSGVILDLNGHALTAEFVYAPLGGDAGIIDSAVKGGGTGKLLLKDMKTSMGYTDGYMPIYAGQEDGLHCYKFYTVKYYPVTNVNRGTDAVEIRFWFIFESKQAYKDILDHPDQFRVQLDTDLGNAEEGGARQTLYFEFRQDMITSWAQQNYNGFDSHNGAKFLVVLRGLDEAKATTIKGTPFAESKYTMAKYYGNDITIK